MGLARGVKTCRLSGYCEEKNIIGSAHIACLCFLESRKFVNTVEALIATTLISDQLLL